MWLVWLLSPWLEECCVVAFCFFGFLDVDAVVLVVGVEVVVAAVVVVVVAHSPSVSPCATCAATAGRAITIVCSLPDPVW